MLRMSPSNRPTAQMEVLRKEKDIFPGITNYTDTKWMYPYCLMVWLVVLFFNIQVPFPTLKHFKGYVTGTYCSRRKVVRREQLMMWAFFARSILRTGNVLWTKAIKESMNLQEKVYQRKRPNGMIYLSDEMY